MTSEELMDKVQAGLDAHLATKCADCPYDSRHECVRCLMIDARVLLQEAREREMSRMMWDDMMEEVRSR